MIFAAIDPGAVSAAIAVFDDATPLFVDDIRTALGMVDSVALAKALADMKIQHLATPHENPRHRSHAARPDDFRSCHPQGTWFLILDTWNCSTRSCEVSGPGIDYVEAYSTRKQCLVAGSFYAEFPGHQRDTSGSHLSRR